MGEAEPDMAAELNEQVMIRLNSDLLERLRATSEANERTVSQTVRLAIKAYLASLEGSLDEKHRGKR